MMGNNQKIFNIIVGFVFAGLALLMLYGFVELLRAVINLAVLVVDKSSSLIAFIVAVATVGAAVATWRAAKKAAESAQIARESMNATMVLGKQTLAESQTTNKRTAFESRYAMLLAQHDHYHQQLCIYLDSGWSSKNKKGSADSNHNDDNPVAGFFDKSIYAEKLDDCFSFLTGHQIISRYMRVLYHLLKFVRENGDFNGPDNITFQKNYTSPVRSTIRNDVLLLIAVNALNVNDERAKNSSYPYYQKLLHHFDFFEHAIFMFPSNPNELFRRDDWENRIHELVISTQSQYSTRLSSQSKSNNRSFKIPEVRLVSPLMMVIVIFKNPMRDAAFEAFDSMCTKSEVNAKVIDKVKEMTGYAEFSKKIIETLPSCEFRSASNTQWQKITEDILSEMFKEAFSPGCRYDEYSFKLAYDGSVYSHYGSFIRDHLRTIKRAESIVHEFGPYTGQDDYEGYLAQRNRDSVDKALSEIATYKKKFTDSEK